MGNEIFIDTSAWVALADQKDNYYAAAAQIYPEILTSYFRFVTSNLLVAESYVTIRRELGHSMSIRYLEIMKSARLIVVHSTAELEAEAEKILRQYDDQSFSFADAVSFAVMRERHIQEAFTFDRHFGVLGFTILPKRRSG